MEDRYLLLVIFTLKHHVYHYHYQYLLYLVLHQNDRQYNHYYLMKVISIVTHLYLFIINKRLF